MKVKVRVGEIRFLFLACKKPACKMLVKLTTLVQFAPFTESGLFKTYFSATLDGRRMIRSEEKMEQFLM